MFIYECLFLPERAVAIFGVVGSERKVAEAVQPYFLSQFPIGSQHCLPLGTKCFFLRHDVLDREILGVDLLLAVVLQPVEEIFAVLHAKDVTRLQTLPKFGIGGEALIFALSLQCNLEA